MSGERYRLTWASGLCFVNILTLNGESANLWIHENTIFPQTLNLLSTYIFNWIHIRFGVCCLMPLSKIFQLCRGCQFYWWRKPEKTTNPSCLKYWQTFSFYVVWSTPRQWTRMKLRTLIMISTDCMGSC
jgi:hypothetical protein